MTGPDFTTPVLDGPGDNDYARYMHTEELLSLQRGPQDRIHPDELLFQTVHQGTELWLKESCFEVERSVAELRQEEYVVAAALLRRASTGITVVRQQLAVLRTLNPATFQVIRPALGHGSGAESPGWRAVHRTSRLLGSAVTELIERSATPLVEVYESGRPPELLQVYEAALDWDEQVALWRSDHYKVAIRVIGAGVRGTKGRPVETLTRLLDHTCVPALWELRTTLTQRGPLGDGYGS